MAALGQDDVQVAIAVDIADAALAEVSGRWSRGTTRS